MTHKTLFVACIATCVALAGCATMTPRQKTVAVAVGAALVVGIAAAHDHSRDPGHVTIPPQPGRASAH